MAKVYGCLITGVNNNNSLEVDVTEYRGYLDPITRHMTLTVDELWSYLRTNGSVLIDDKGYSPVADLPPSYSFNKIHSNIYINSDKCSKNIMLELDSSYLYIVGSKPVDLYVDCYNWYDDTVIKSYNKLVTIHEAQGAVIHGEFNLEIRGSIYHFKLDDMLAISNIDNDGYIQICLIAANGDYLRYGIWNLNKGVYIHQGSCQFSYGRPICLNTKNGVELMLDEDVKTMFSPRRNK